MTLDHEFSPEEFATWLSFALVQCGPDAKPADIAGHVARAAYHAGADRELGECEADLRSRNMMSTADRLLETRRPKQPQPVVDKSDAVSALHRVIGALYNGGTCEPSDIGLIRIALDQLPGNPFPNNLK